MLKMTPLITCKQCVKKIECNKNYEDNFCSKECYLINLQIRIDKSCRDDDSHTNFFSS